MGPIDPHQLLKALGPLLTQNGTIKGPTEAARIASLMKDANKIVSRCIYINILKATTTPETMEKFLSVGGWDTLNTWLQSCKDEENYPVLVELLKVYQNLPVSVDILKKNNAAKTIKQLCKAENEQVKNMSTTIVDNWMKKVKGNNNNKDDSKAKKKKKEKEKDREKDSKDKDRSKERDKSDRDKSDKDRSDREKGDKDRSDRDRSDREKGDKDRSDRDRSDKDKSDKSRHRDSRHHHHSHSSRDKSSSSGSRSDRGGKDQRSSDEEEMDTKEGTSEDVPTVSVRQGNGLKLHIKLGGDKSDKSDKDKPESDSGKVEPERKRASTVKRPPMKFRSTGLEEESVLPPKKKQATDPASASSSSSPSSSTSTLGTASSLMKTLTKRQGSDLKSEHPEKKSRLHISVPGTSSSSLPPTTPPSPISPSELHGSIKIIPPRPKPSYEIQESTGFMDDLTRTTGRTTYGAYKKKKKALAAAAANSAAQGSGNKSPTTPTTPVSPNTAIAKSLPTVPSFYKDTLQEEEPAASETKDKERSPSPTEGGIKDENGKKDTEKKEDDAPGKDSDETKTGGDAEAKVEGGAEGDGTETKGLLTTGATKKKRASKRVTWAEDSKIQEVFYFELDENERENVNRPKDFNQAKKQEMLNDRKAVESGKRLVNDNMIEQIPWYRPVPIAGLTTVVEPGKDSVEKTVQKERELKVLQALFFNKLMLPDTPGEPELESEDVTEPKNIPLEDSSGGEEYLYNYDEHPKAVSTPPGGPANPPPNAPGLGPGGMPDLQALQQSLPPELAGILGSIQASGQDSSVLANVHNMLQSIIQSGGGEQGYEQLQQLLDPMNPNNIMGMQGPPMDGMMHPPGMPQGPMHGPPGPGPGPGMGPRTGLLGQAPPGFLPQRPMGPPRFGPPGPRGPPEGENWDMGGGPMGPGRGPPPRLGFRGPMHGPPRGRGGRGVNRTVCRHFKSGGCRRGNQCGFLHPGINGPMVPMDGPMDGPPHQGMGGPPGPMMGGPPGMGGPQGMEGPPP